MRLVYRDISDKDAPGSVTLIPEDDEDMWHAYNLIAEGDRVRSTTIRKVQTESATGSSTSNRVRTVLTIAVESVDFDFAACQLRLKGRNVQENQYVKMGAYHTLDLEQNRKFTITKDEWDAVALDQLDLACDPAKSADVGAVVMQEGLAFVCLVTPNMTLIRAKIEVNIPRKRRGNCSQHDKGLVRFFEQVMQSILRVFDFSLIKCVVIASPGFVKDQFFDYMYAEAVKADIKVLFENKGKFFLVHSSSGHKHALNEVLQDAAVSARLADTKAAGEVKALQCFYQMLQNEPNKAFYGVDHVERAAEEEAIETLLLSDSLFRVKEVAGRRRYVALVEKVREASGDVKIFSSSHVSGEQLEQLSGVAAILRFEMPDLDNDSSDDDSSGNVATAAS